MARDKFQKFLGIMLFYCSVHTDTTSLVGSVDSEDGGEGVENQSPQVQRDTTVRRSKRRLTIDSDDEENVEGVNPSDSDHSTESGPSKSFDVLALRSQGASRHSSNYANDQGLVGERRHSSRLDAKHRYNGGSDSSSIRRRHFYMDELEVEHETGNEEEEFEGRSLSAFQRYNLRNRKKSPSAFFAKKQHEFRHVSRPKRYNLRPHRGTRHLFEYEVPWSVADEYVLSEKPKRQLIPTEAALLKATPELQPYEHPDTSQNHEDDSSMLGDEAITATQTFHAQGSEPPFKKIAGMDEYVKQLKEMVVFPLLYPSFFNRLGVSPPRGVLFHGPPGTGKTLMARLLAESCSNPNRKVSFFMRNGSDCLSKWIGEAERNMKLLFQKAKESQPSIIFFDEIDGLAPERSGRADQSHISLVSTLLALMDGLDDRGNVVVIGATNRIHAIDPALRRPGRFDKEFYFGLPSELTRVDILKIQTRTWDPKPCEDLLIQLASLTLGFSGADLKGLCTEAALHAIRRTCPEAYEGTAAEAHFLDRQIVVSNDDFYAAYNKIVPSTRRHDQTEQLVIPMPWCLLTDKTFSFVLENIKTVVGSQIPSASLTFDGSSWALERNHVEFISNALPSNLINRLLRLAACRLEQFKVFCVSFERLVDDPSLLQQLSEGVLRDAKARSPSIVLIPDMEECRLKTRVRKVIRHFVSSLLPSEPILVLSVNFERKSRLDCLELTLLDIEPQDYRKFIEHVLTVEVKAIVVQKLSNLQVLTEHGNGKEVDLSQLLVSPFPDYEAFCESITILPNREDILNCVSELLCLNTADWYRSLIAPVLGEFPMSSDFFKTRADILHRAQRISIPTPESLTMAFSKVKV